ncbi:DUF6452 family protein [Flavobacterium agrisoli]|uniref:Lipoprotein n=1 Tax=Flavobacterium agrisoli TaxID=2793066 RepID=A0A934UIX3_9FLAO|nr:DUF6452 family protein [Flavobacterium agrisoli]MBK0368868.1 hypothetical protein [Flavobacterium agrisoli]
MKKIISLVLLFTFALSGCEKDDICDANTPTTPRLIIEFYDINNPDLLKTVTNLKVIGQGMSEGIVFNETATDDSKYRTNASSIAIPLKTNEDTCTYSFILNDGNSNPALINEDIITFNYSRRDEYVSRACGFKTVYELNSSNPFVQTDGVNNDGSWMQIVELVEPNIENENEAHFKVFF